MSGPAIDWNRLEVSDPQFETGGLRQVTVKSRHLHGRGDITLAIPGNIGELTCVPVVILLHGIFGSHWAWALKGGAHLTSSRMAAGGDIPPVILAMPSDGLWGDGTGYLPHARADYESWIAHDVPAVVDHLLPDQARGGPLFIGGLSMGGYGALRLAAKFGRAKFKAAAALSPATRFERLLEFSSESRADFAGAPPDNVLDLLLANRYHLPPLQILCGVGDLLLEDSRSLHKSLLAVRIPHDYAESPGAHDWTWWAEHLPDSLRFFATHL